MASKREEVIQTTFEADELARTYDTYVARLKAACVDFKPPVADLGKLAKAMGSGKKAMNFVAAFDGKQLSLTIEHGSSVLARSRQEVWDEPNVNKRRRMTEGLVKLGVMKQAEAGQLDRATLSPDRRAIDAVKREAEALADKIKEAQGRKQQAEADLAKLDKERSAVAKKLKDVAAQAQ